MAGVEEKGVDDGYTKDGTVDLRGNPVLRSKSGGWTACSFVVGTLSLSLSPEVTHCMRNLQFPNYLTSNFFFICKNLFYGVSDNNIERGDTNEDK